MTIEVAIAWVEDLLWNERLLGIWRSQRGPGPFSIFVLDRNGKEIVECWAVPGERGGKLYGKLYGKRLERAA